MKKLLFILMLILVVIPCYPQQLYFGVRINENGNEIYQKNPDPISVLFIREDTSFCIFHFWYENVYTNPYYLYSYDSKYAFTPQNGISLIARGKMEMKNGNIFLYDSDWLYSIKLVINKDSTLTYEKGMLYFNNWKYIDFKKLFKDCKDKKSYVSLVNQFKDAIITDSVLAYHEDDKVFNNLKKSLQHSKSEMLFQKNVIFEDSLSKIRLEFHNDTYKIKFMRHDKLFSVGKIYKSQGYVLLDDDEAGQDYIIKFISESEFELINCHPLLKGLQIYIPLDNHKLGFKPWTFRKIENK